MKEYGTLSPVCRVLAHYLNTALNSIFLRILGRLKANPPLNNVNFVKNEIFESYFEQYSHFSTV